MRGLTGRAIIGTASPVAGVLMGLVDLGVDTTPGYCVDAKVVDFCWTTFGGVLKAAVGDGKEQFRLEQEVAEAGRMNAHVRSPDNRRRSISTRDSPLETLAAKAITS